MFKKPFILLSLIVVLGFAIRAFKVVQMPLYGDELTMVYDTYSILKTGKDATGEVLPLTFRMGSGRPGGYIYASLPFVYLFGPSALGVRSLSLLSGLGVVILVYFLGKKLFTQKIGLIAAFLTAVSPWDIYLSRAGFEAHFALFLALFGIVAFLYQKYFAWAIFWGLTVLTYPTFKLTLPLVFLLLIRLGGVKIYLSSKKFLLSLLILAAFGALVFGETLKGRSEQRFLSLNIFSERNLNRQLIEKVTNERNFSTLPSRIKPYFFNRPIEYSRIIAENYIENLSPDFLFLRGDRNPRHNPGEWGMLYLAEMPLIIFGLISLFKEKRKEFFLVSGIILITPLATMLLGQTHALRNALMLPFFALVSAYGLSKLSGKPLYVFMFLVFSQLLLILSAVYFLAPGKFAEFWSRDAKTAALEAIEKSKNEKVFLSTKKIDNIEYAYEVYAKVDPAAVITQYGKFPKTFGNVTIIDK